jgi:hypothetical protein
MGKHLQVGPWQVSSCSIVVYKTYVFHSNNPTCPLDSYPLLPCKLLPLITLNKGVMSLCLTAIVLRSRCVTCLRIRACSYLFSSFNTWCSKESSTTVFLTMAHSYSYQLLCLLSVPYSIRIYSSLRLNHLVHYTIRLPAQSPQGESWVRMNYLQNWKIYPEFIEFMTRMVRHLEAYKIHGIKICKARKTIRRLSLYYDSKFIS